MRSLSMLTLGFVLAGASLLSGCLVSEEPVLNAGTGKAAPLKDGLYSVCEDEATEESCTLFEVARTGDGGYLFTAEGEEPAALRFRRIARKAYAVQSAENDGYAYYYGEGDSKAFSLTMMMCDALPEDLRARLIDKGDLSSDSEDFEVCTVNTVKGLTQAAKAWRKQAAGDDEQATITLKPAAQEAGD